MPSGTTEQQQLAAKRHITWLITALLILAALGIGGRLLYFGQDSLAGGDRLWRLGIEALVRSEGTETTIQIYPPYENNHLRVIQRTLHHAGFRIRNWSDDEAERRSIRAFASSAGKKIIGAEFVIHQKTQEPATEPGVKAELSTTQREEYLQDNERLELNHPKIKQVLQKLTQQQVEPQQLVEKIFDYLQHFAVSYGSSTLHAPSVLTKRKATALDRSLSMVALCRAAGMPARIVMGLVLKEEFSPEPHYWTEVYVDDKWFSYDIQSGYQQAVPANYLALRRNGIDTVQVMPGELLRLDYELEREYDHPYLRQLKQENYLNILDLTRLPLDVRNELALLMLLPLGALISAMARHLAGLHSYGVFTPTLLALALVYTDPVTTAVIFVVVCFLAIAGRSLFPDDITRIPRLAIIFTLVAMIMTLSTSVLAYFDIGQGGKVILLPIIILTTLIDRLYRTIEDRGVTIAMRRLVWTLLLALICLPLIKFEALGHLFVAYPELHFITLALFLLISLYKGKQLVHLPFIRIFAEPDVPARKTRKKTKKSTTKTEQHAS